MTPAELSAALDDPTVQRKLAIAVLAYKNPAALPNPPGTADVYALIRQAAAKAAPTANAATALSDADVQRVAAAVIEGLRQHPLEPQ